MLLSTATPTQSCLTSEVRTTSKSKSSVFSRGDTFHTSVYGCFNRSIPLTKLCLLREMAALSVGARIVALYGHLGIFYAGIVAEVACEENGDRILVFFDDGFAQYLCPENVYLVAKCCELFFISGMFVFIF